METGYCNGSKNLKIIKVKTEPKRETCSGIESSRSGETKFKAKKEACSREASLKTGGKGAEIKICGINWTYIPGCKELKPELETGLWSGFPEERLENKELKPELEIKESSWNNLKLILSYPCSLRSFYTARESVKINYKGSEVLKEQKVDIYLVKTCNSSFSEEAVKNVKNCSTIRFEDIFNKNTEFYIQIPATLNEYGNLSPLTLGPLPEGSYWILVTLAGNETKADKPEKTILLANYFEVLRYEMEAEAPHTLEAGKDFEVKLDLKNVPAQENCTYWAVLIKEDACRTNMSSGDTYGTKAVSGTFVQELRLLRDFGLNSTNYESETGKDELKSKIQTLIGQGNGTISIGEENQSTLTLKSLGLAPGNYLLFAGAYEKEGGLAGMVQEKLTISPARKEDSDSKPYSGDYNFRGITSKGQSFLLSVS
jgi:methanogen extracellular protein (TIGR04279 family)